MMHSIFLGYSKIASSGSGSSTYQWSDGVIASGWYASDLSDYMFDNPNSNTWAKAETSGTDYLGWDRYGNGADLPFLTGPVDIFLRYSEAGYSFEVNGSSITPDVSGATGATGGWVTLSTGNVSSFKVTAPNTASNVSIGAVRSNGYFVTETSTYPGDQIVTTSSSISTVGYEFYTKDDNSNIYFSNNPAKVVLDDAGNVYGITNTTYFKIDGYNGDLVWHKVLPSAYREGTSASGLSAISVSPDGTHLAIAGPGGAAAHNGRGYEMVVTKINVSNGTPLKNYRSWDDSLPRTIDINSVTYGTDARVYDIIVDNDGICNCVGNFYYQGDQPLGEFSRFVINFTNDNIIWAGGETNSDYTERWDNIDTAGLYIAMEGMDQFNAVQQTGYQTHNWTLMNRASNTREWSKTYQSNNGNGIRGYGVAVTPLGQTFGGYRDDTVGTTDGNGVLSGKSGIVHFNINGNIESRTPLYKTSDGDLNPLEVQTDGTNIYVLLKTWSTTPVEWYIVSLDIATKTVQWSSRISRATYESIEIKEFKYNASRKELDISGKDSTDKIFVFSVPADGGGSGSYGSYIYQSATITKDTTDGSSWYSGTPPTFADHSSSSDDSSVSSSVNLFNMWKWGVDLESSQDEWTEPGTYTWTCPPNVRSVSAICVGAGGRGGGAGGGGGGLGWKNNITVSPGSNYTIVVGEPGDANNGNWPAGNGGDSYFINATTVKGGGGGNGGGPGTQYIGVGGDFVGDGGGNGGDGSDTNGWGGGGGGAGGYSGDGGDGGNSITYQGQPGSGGAGGGGASHSSLDSNDGKRKGGGGGGVGIYGERTSGGYSEGGASEWRTIGLEGWPGTHNAPILFTQAIDDTTGGSNQYDWLRDYVDDMRGYGFNGVKYNTQSIDLVTVDTGGHNAFVTDATLQAAIRDAFNSNAGSTSITAPTPFTIVPTDGETYTIDGTSYPVMGKLYVPTGLAASSIDAVVVFHGTIATTSNIAQEAANMLDRFVDTTVTNLNIRDKIVFSVAYPQDHVPQAKQYNLTGVGTEEAGFLMGDNLPYARAAVGWVQNSLDAYIAAQGGSKTVGNVYLFGHSQGGKLVAKINTLDTGIAGVVSNSPGPIRFAQTCSASSSTSCSKVQTAHGTPYSTYGGDGGQAGSSTPETYGGADGSQGEVHDGGSGGPYGGGGGGSNDNSGSYSDAPGRGAVRLIWGPGRSFPTTYTTKEFKYKWQYNIGDWVPEQGGYYAGLLTTLTESYANLDPAGTQYRIFIAEKSVSQSTGQYKNAASCDGSHTYTGTSPSGSTTAPNAQYDGYFNTYSSVLANASATTHPVFHAVQNLSITVDGTVFDDWYIPAHQEAGIVYYNLKNSSSWQSSSQAFDLTSAGTSNAFGELWTSSGDSCSNAGVLTSAGKWFPGGGGNGLVYGYAKNETASIRPVRRVAV